MTTSSENGAAFERWRFTTTEDAPFLYDLVLQLDPYCWRISRLGTTPQRAVEAFGLYSASVTVLDDSDAPCGFAGLVNLSGTNRCAQLDLHALPDPTSEGQVRSVAHELVGAAFDGSPVDQLYVEHFDGEPDLLTMLTCFTTDVVMPEFAIINGVATTRFTRGVTRSEFAAWRSDRQPG